MADVGIPKGTNAESHLEAMFRDIEKLAPRLSHGASRNASSRLDTLQRILVYRSIETYDPADKAGFPLVMKALADHVPDQCELSALFGISVSTLYRWKSGESVPGQLARRAVKEHLLQLLGEPFEAIEPERGIQTPLAN